MSGIYPEKGDTMKIMIFKANVKDIPILEVLQKELYGEWFDSHHVDITQAVLNGRVWIMREQSMIIGYQLCELFGPTEKYFPNSIFLSELFVIPNHRKQGIGSRLIQTALNNPWPSEYGYFSLTYDENELNLKSYYQKFRITEYGKTDTGNMMMKRFRY